MKNLFVIIALAVVTLFSSCTKEQTVASRFMVVGDYSFEMLSGLDEYGEIKIRVKNIKGIPFTCDEYANEIEGVRSIISTEWVEFASIVGLSERTLKIHYTSGLRIDTQLKGIVFNETKNKLVSYDVTSVVCGYNPPDRDNLVFECASNFFGIN